MNIAIVTGGSSAEREISLLSAKNIQSILSIPEELIFDYPRDIEKIAKAKLEIDICIPLIHGKDGEDGHIQSILEKLDIPYIFSKPKAHLDSFNKRKAKDIVSTLNIATAREFEKDDVFKGNFFVKPISGGSSICTQKIKSSEELMKVINDNPQVEFIIEDELIGREFSVGVIDTASGSKILPVVEIISKNNFFDYESKYNNSNLVREICPANISDELNNSLQDAAVLIHHKLQCKDISRSDFIVSDNIIYFLEVNTIPGMTEKSLIPKELQAANISLKNLFEFWIDQSIKK